MNDGDFGIAPDRQSYRSPWEWQYFSGPACVATALGTHVADAHKTAGSSDLQILKRTHVPVAKSSLGFHPVSYVERYLPHIPARGNIGQ